MSAQGNQGRGQGQRAIPQGKPINDHGVLIAPTASEIGRIEAAIRKLAEQLAVKQLEGVSGAEEIDTRDLIPSHDLDSGTDNGWTTGTREWTQTGLTADQFNETYVVDGEEGNAQDKVVILAVVQNPGSSPATTEVRFDDGTGGTFERLQLEGILIGDNTSGLVADPLINFPDKSTSINQYVTATSDELQFQGVVAEKSGSTLAESSRFAREQAANVGGVSFPG